MADRASDEELDRQMEDWPYYRMQQLREDTFDAICKTGKWPDGTALTDAELRMFQEEHEARQIRRGDRLPDDARCETCRFWQIRKGSLGCWAGECRIRSMHKFPDMAVDDWCGEWEPDFG